jgi:hypothetical protein
MCGTKVLLKNDITNGLFQKQIALSLQGDRTEIRSNI